MIQDNLIESCHIMRLFWYIITSFEIGLRYRCLTPNFVLQEANIDKDTAGGKSVCKHRLGNTT